MKNVESIPTSASLSYTVKSLAKALHILDVFAEGEESAYTLTQLSRLLHLHISTVHRLMANLVSHGFVEEAPGRFRFQLSFKVLRMGLRVANRLDFRRVAEPILRKLNQQTEETVHLAFLQAGRALVVESYPTPQPASPDARVGEALPLHSSGVGKIILAYQKRGLLKEVARKWGFPHFTPRTITTLANLKKELDRIREQGYALEREETAKGLSGVAGPVFEHTGLVVAAFAVVGPTKRLTASRVPEIARLVSSASQQISYRLGYGVAGR